MTNEEYIRSLPIKVLADTLGYDADFCRNECPYRHDDGQCSKRSCRQGRIEWLKQEHEEREENERRNV